MRLLTKKIRGCWSSCRSHRMRIRTLWLTSGIRSVQVKYHCFRSPTTRSFRLAGSMLAANAQALSRRPLERLTKPKIEDPIADEGRGQFPEGIIETGAALVADPEAAELLVPTQGAFDRPAKLAQPAAVAPAAMADDWFDLPPAEFLLLGRRLVGRIPLQAL